MFRSTRGENPFQGSDIQRTFGPSCPPNDTYDFYFYSGKCWFGADGETEKMVPTGWVSRFEWFSSSYLLGCLSGTRNFNLDPNLGWIWHSNFFYGFDELQVYVRSKIKLTQHHSSFTLFTQVFGRNEYYPGIIYVNSKPTGKRETTHVGRGRWRRGSFVDKWEVRDRGSNTGNTSEEVRRVSSLE